MIILKSTGGPWHTTAKFLGAAKFGKNFYILDEISVITDDL